MNWEELKPYLLEDIKLWDDATNEETVVGKLGVDHETFMTMTDLIVTYAVERYPSIFDPRSVFSMIQVSMVFGMTLQRIRDEQMEKLKGG